MTGVKISTDNVEVAKKQFANLQNKRDLMGERQRGGICASRLYKYVLGHADDEVNVALKTDLALRRVYKNFLQQSSYFHIPQAIAASTDELPERHCDGCTIRFQASRAESDQVYLIIDIADQRRDMPSSLSVFLGEEACETLQLPAARNGVIQTIIDKKSDLAKLLAEPKSEIYLR